MSQLKIKDGNSWVAIPASGVGVPSGGSSGQYLRKSSSTDYATEWANQDPEYTSSQTLTKTTSSQTCTGTFYRLGNLVMVSISSTGSFNTGNDWQEFFSGLNAEFQPNETVIASVGQAPNHVQGFKVYGKNDADAGKVKINMSNTSAWVEGSFVYIV